MSHAPMRSGMRVALLLVFYISSASYARKFSNKDLIQPLPLEDIKLQPGSHFDKAVSLNKEYLLGLDTDRLLKTFRLNAGLDAPGEPFAGSWEDPSCEVRGQYLGHWLSGTAVLGNYSGDGAVRRKAAYIVAELRKVQKALGGGYLSAFPTEHFVRLRNLQAVWAPFYVIHKIMAGLLDQYLFLGDTLALQMIADEAAFFEAYAADVFAKEGRAHWLQMLENEYGGMEEVLFNLHGATGDERWARMAVLFTKPNFFDPLLGYVDTLPGRHANTHLAQINGFAAGFEKTGDKDRLKATANFFDIIGDAHSYATGGSNANEFWQAPHELGATVGPDGSGRDTEETCTTYNMMKISRYLFRWSGDLGFCDHYERAALNGMLGTQRMPADYSPSHGSLAAQRNASAKGGRALLSQPAGLTGLINASNRTLQPGWQVAGVQQQAVQPQATALHWRALARQRFPPTQAVEQGNDPGPGVIIYLLPLGAANTKDDSWHHWSTPLNSFWCCSGSTSEQFGKLMDSIYFERQTEDSPPVLYVAQFTPSTLNWRLGGLRVTLNASLYTCDNVARVSIGFKPLATLGPGTHAGGGGGGATVKIRVPGWLNRTSASAALNGGELTAAGAEVLPGSYLALTRNFEAGDVIDLKLPMKIEAKPIDDWRPEYQNLQAVTLGPFVMAALTDGERAIQADPARIAALVRPISDAALISLAGAGGSMLRQGPGGRVVQHSAQGCLPRSDCTFRLLQRSFSDGAVKLTPLERSEDGLDVVIESMNWPGAFLWSDPRGGLSMLRSLPGAAQTWRYSPSADGAASAAGARQGAGLAPGSVSAAAAGADPGTEGAAGPTSLGVVPALGAYPEGARLLVGEDRIYVLAPIGLLVEERYTPYLEFTRPAATATASGSAMQGAW